MLVKAVIRAGVSGIGKAYADKLISAHGSLEGIYASIDKWVKLVLAMVVCDHLVGWCMRTHLCSFDYAATFVMHSLGPVGCMRNDACVMMRVQ
jgi:hypothetical protein